MDILHAFLVHAESAKHFKITGSQGPTKALFRENRVLRGRPVELSANTYQQAKQRVSFKSLTGSSWAKLFVNCLSNKSSVERNRMPSALAMRVDMSEQPSLIQRWLVWRVQKYLERRKKSKRPLFYLILFHIREAMTEWVEEGQEFANESRNFNCLFHALRVEEGAFD